jgi:hypothetical protein
MVDLSSLTPVLDEAFAAAGIALRQAAGQGNGGP